ncbi:unnamed protein product [Fusarium graminearum]|uniref:Chromosome 3, complete genome n=1 Tax=Gibberella zeae (strain ATCC MYA-4620 / CBS 123657 / FGSC 9075 / NRRL 31084 / PH-1) TaxID=229533 RepID=A0A0E0SIR9_GIBZE|nr:hypothetical protein FG05_35036 [Fusarium graminearum]CEF86332.1 unnamed protein product [Fusarium graminearum]
MEPCRKFVSIVLRTKHFQSINWYMYESTRYQDRLTLFARLEMLVCSEICCL